MIAKTSKSGKGFGGVLSYCLGEGKMSEILAQNHCFGDNSKDLAWQFRDVANQNVNVKNPVFHASLSFPEQTTEEKMTIIAKDFLEKMGFSDNNNQYVIIAHRDHDNYQHLHIVANRVALDGKVFKDSFSQSKAVKVAKELENKYSLKKVEDIRKGVIRGNPKESLDDVSLDMIRGSVRMFQTSSNSLADFVRNMKSLGVKTDVFCRTNGDVYGLAYSYEGKYYKSSQLGKQFSYANFVKGAKWYHEEQNRKEQTQLREINKYAIEQEAKNKATGKSNENNGVNVQELRNNQNVGLKKGNNDNLSL